MEKRLLLFLSLLFSLLICAIGSSNFPAIFIFGDSLFDAGNNHFNRNCTAQADFPPYGSTFFHRPTGRFTNGRTVADFIGTYESRAHTHADLFVFWVMTYIIWCAAEFIGMPLQKPYMEIELENANTTRKNFPANGINFASAGSGVLPATNNDAVRYF